MSSRSGDNTPTEGEATHKKSRQQAGKTIVDGNAYQLETLARLSPAGIFRTDDEGHCTYVSERWCEMAGVDPEHALGMGWMQVIHPDDREQVARDWYAAVAARRDFCLECRFQTPDGQTRWVLGRATVEQNASGELIGYIGTVTDITHQKQTERALQTREAELQALVQNIPGTVYRCLLDQDWTALFLSDHIETLSGYPLTDFTDGPLRSHKGIIHPDDRAMVDRRVREAVAQHSHFSLEYRIIHADGQVRWVMENGQASLDETGEVAWLEGVITDITERKSNEDKLRRHSRKLQALLDLSQEFASLDLDKVLQTTTDRVTQLSQFKSAAVYLLDGDRLDLWAATPPLPPDFPDDLRHAPLSDHPHIGKAITTQRPVFMPDTATATLTEAERRVSELRNLRSNLYLPLLAKGEVLGTLIVTSVTKPQALPETQAELCQTLANMAVLAVQNARLYQASRQYATDLEQKMGECKTVETALRNSESRYRHMFQANPHPMWVFDLESLKFLAVNDAAMEHYGYTQNEFLSMTLETVSLPEDAARLRQSLAQPVASGVDNAGIWRHVKRDGTLIDVAITYHAMTFDGRAAKLALAYDITERKQAEERIQQLAHFDSLTGLPNRSLLEDRIAQAISLAHRHRQTVALVFIDLDHFKQINDTLGHRIGDQLLIEVAKRLRKAVREEDTVSRFGGDEFILLLPETDADGAARVVEKLLETIAHHYQIGQHELFVTCSIGIAMYPNDGDDLNSLSMRADAAMYRAKRDGRNSSRFFTSEMQTRSARNLKLRSSLLRALEQDQLQLHYQPQLSLQDGVIIGAEALLRWQHPELGWISPVEFVPLAEDSGAIIAIGDWVLQTAVRQLKAWIDSGLPPMIIAVNLSAVQFRHANLVQRISEIVSEAGLSSELLELELTETVAMDNPLSAVNVMDQLHDYRVRTAIDDFGTGHSSLSYLKRFHVQRLKISQTFICDVAVDSEDQAIVMGIINMARGLGLTTLAEGVETREQLDFLIQRGCHEIQGNYCSKPLTPQRLESFLRNRSVINPAR